MTDRITKRPYATLLALGLFGSLLAACTALSGPRAPQASVDDRVTVEEARRAFDGSRFEGKTFSEWRTALALKPSEAPWEQIPWLPTFADGIRAADRAQKPLLLWVMNGHPLGCT